MNKQTLVAAIAAAFLLGACGGGSDPVVAASDAVPGSASQSADGLVAWLTALSQDDADTKEPLDLSAFTPPTSEAAEPVALR